MHEKTVDKVVANGEASRLFTEILDSGADLRMRVTGSSMAPTIRDGDQVTLRKIPAGKLVPGDIVWLIDNSGNSVVHRIMKKRVRLEKTCLHTKGDALIEYDQWADEKNILGKICRIEKTRAGRPPRSINLETARWRAAGFIITLFQIMRSKVVLAVRSRLS